MKFIGFAAILAMCSISASAQFAKGDKFVEGIIGFQSFVNPATSSQYAYSTRSYSITPLAGYFLSSKWAVGVLAGYSYSYYKNDNGSYVSTDIGNTYSGGASIIRYFQISEKFYFTVDGAIIFSRGSTNSESIPTDPSQASNVNTAQGYQLTARLQPSFLFFPSPRWGFKLTAGSISYTHSQSLSDDSSSNSIYFYGGGNLNLGVQYYFRQPR